MAKHFSFANLFPGGRSKSAGRVDPKAQEDEDDDDQETSAQEDDEEETPPAAQEDDEEETSAQEDEEEDEDMAAANARGRRAERRRIAQILGSDAVSPGNFAQACAIACNTDLAPKEAVDILKAAPEAGRSRLSAAMQGRSPKAITAPADGTAKGPSCADLMRQRFSKAS